MIKTVGVSVQPPFDEIQTILIKFSKQLTEQEQAKAIIHLKKRCKTLINVMLWETCGVVNVLNSDVEDAKRILENLDPGFALGVTGSAFDLYMDREI